MAQDDGDRIKELEAEVARLRAQADTFEEVLSRSNDVIYRVNLRNRKLDFISASTERLFGRPREEILVQPPEAERERIHPDDRQRVADALTQLGRGQAIETSQVLEYRVRHVDGSYRCVREVREIIVEEGEPVAFVGTVTDVTDARCAEREQLALESQIQQAQKLESLGVLAGGIAHDFNNLLVGILGNAGLALLDLTPEAPARQAVREIEETAVRATELVRQMLAYSGKGRFVIEPLDLRGVVEQMTHLLEVAVSKNAVLRYEYGRGVPHVDADATQVRQVIMNLVTNASDAIGERSGVISVATGAMECDRAYLSETYLDDDLEEGIYAYIEVSDSGGGIEPDSVDRIFDPFYSTKFTGRGLGLAAVLGIVRGHRGAIKVYSEPGKGSTFKALFPAREHAHEVAVPPSPSASMAYRGTGAVLLVDDEETVRAVGRRMLERLGFEVVTAEDGRQALECFNADPARFRCVLLDLTMPHLDGEACFRELRRVRADVRVVLSSGYNEQELINRFAGKGLAGFIQKPYRPAQLADKLREVLGDE